MVIQGIVTWALHEYTPPSSFKTGENVRMCVITLLEFVYVVLTIIRSLVSTIEPSALLYQFTSGTILIPVISRTVHSSTYLCSCKASPLVVLMISIVAQELGTKEYKNIYYVLEQTIGLRSLP